MSFEPGGVDWAARQATLQNWVVNGSGLPSASVVWGQQDAPRPPAPAIVLRISNVAETGKSWVDRVANPLTFAPLVVTAIDPVANTLTVANHGRATGDGPVQFTTTGVLPGVTGAALALAADYWLIAPDANTLQIARSYADTGGGQGAGNPITPIDLTDIGTGTLTISSTANTVAAGAELQYIVRGYLRVTLEMHCHSAPGVGIDLATAILQRVRSRRMQPSQMDLLNAANIGLIEVERVRAVTGVRDALLFEPRAFLDVHFCVPSEEALTGPTVIETVDVTDQISGQTYPVGVGGRST